MSCDLRCLLQWLAVLASHPNITLNVDSVTNTEVNNNNRKGWSDDSGSGSTGGCRCLGLPHAFWDCHVPSSGGCLRWSERDGSNQTLYATMIVTAIVRNSLHLGIYKFTSLGYLGGHCAGCWPEILYPWLGLLDVCYEWPHHSHGSRSRRCQGLCQY